MVTKISDQQRSSMNCETLHIRKENIAQNAVFFFSSMNRQTRVNINKNVAFLLTTVGQKIKILLSPTLPPPYFKTFVTHPPKINELDTVVTATPCPPTLTPPNLERALTITLFSGSRPNSLPPPVAGEISKCRRL